MQPTTTTLQRNNKPTKNVVNARPLNNPSSVNSLGRTATVTPSNPGIPSAKTQQAAVTKFQVPQDNTPKKSAEQLHNEAQELRRRREESLRKRQEALFGSAITENDKPQINAASSIPSSLAGNNSNVSLKYPPVSQISVQTQAAARKQLSKTSQNQPHNISQAPITNSFAPIPIASNPVRESLSTVHSNASLQHFNVQESSNLQPQSRVEDPLTHARSRIADYKARALIRDINFCATSAEMYASQNKFDDAIDELISLSVLGEQLNDTNEYTSELLPIARSLLKGDYKDSKLKNLCIIDIPSKEECAKMKKQQKEEIKKLKKEIKEEKKIIAKSQKSIDKLGGGNKSNSTRPS
jgi:ElaB/YqjD/DUF883 family membrane-anchored ribosome-binding protein